MHPDLSHTPDMSHVHSSGPAVCRTGPPRCAVIDPPPAKARFPPASCPAAWIDTCATSTHTHTLPPAQQPAPASVKDRLHPRRCRARGPWAAQRRRRRRQGQRVACVWSGSSCLSGSSRSPAPGRHTSAAHACGGPLHARRTGSCAVEAHCRADGPLEGRRQPCRLSCRTERHAVLGHPPVERCARVPVAGPMQQAHDTGKVPRWAAQSLVDRHERWERREMEQSC